MRRLRASLSPNDSARRFTSLGVDVFLGEGKFTGPETIQVGDASLRFSKAAICTGARAASPDIPGIEGGRIPDQRVRVQSHRATPSPRSPRRGADRLRAGPGVRAIRQPRDGHRAIRTDPPPRRRRGRSSRPGQDAGRWRGLSLRFQADTGRTSSGGEGPQSRDTWSNLGEGRRRDPRGRGPGAECRGSGTGGRWASTTASRRASRSTIDSRPPTRGSSPPATSASPYKFTHVADALAQIVIQNALFPHPLGLGYATTDRLVIPWCTYTDPELAHVGMIEKEADEQGDRDRHLHRQARRGRPGHPRRRDGKASRGSW